MSRFESLRRTWGGLALVFLNSCILLLLLNAGLFVVFRALDGRRAQPHRDARSPEALSRHGVVHPGLDRDEIRALWEETYLASSGFVYEPFTQYRVDGFSGRYVTIDAAGFRRHPGTGTWPPDPATLSVFLYGGSTAFGYGVPDDETVAAHLERWLAEAAGGRAVRVYNFGRAGYFSTQERLLFEGHLTHGMVPDVALFLDGLNDTRIADGLPIFTGRLRKLFATPGGSPGAALARLPMMRLARALTGGGRAPAAAAAAPPAEEIAARMAARYLANRRMIESVAAAHGVAALFVWQPISFYSYDRRHHLFPDGAEPPHVAAGYAHMAGIAADGQLGDSFLWLADLQVGLEEPLYVDQAHYSGPMGRRIAAAIGGWAAARGVLRGDADSDSG